MNEKKQKKTRKRIGFLLFVLVNVAVIGVTAYVDFGKQEGGYHAPKELRPLMLLWVLGCFAAAMFAETMKYYIMIRHSTGKKDMKMAFRVAALGKYYDNITPLGAGGQPFQGVYLAKHGVEAGTATAIPVAGFVALQFAFIILAILVFIFGGGVLKLVTVRVAAVVGFFFYIFMPVAVLFFMILPKAAEKVIRFCVRLLAKLHIVRDAEKAEEKAVNTLRASKVSIISICKGKRIFIWLVLLSLLYQVAVCAMPYFVLHAFGNQLPFLQVSCATVLIYLCITFVPTPGNSGMAEGSFYALFSVLEQTNLFWAMLVWRFSCYYMFIGAGLLVTMKEALERRHLERNVAGGQHDSTV